MKSSFYVRWVLSVVSLSACSIYDSDKIAYDSAGFWDGSANSILSDPTEGEGVEEGDSASDTNLDAATKDSATIADAPDDDTIDTDTTENDDSRFDAAATSDSGLYDSGIDSGDEEDAEADGSDASDAGPPTPTCDDSEKNGEETDVDCGGSGTCPRCDNGEACIENSDCETDTCVLGYCCNPSLNTDGDSMNDCSEAADEDPWTDPSIFNGVHVIQRSQCPYSDLVIPTCPNIGTSEVKNCMNTGSVQEETDQYSGWDWSTSATNICDSGYGFAPNWSECNTSWQIQWSGYINLIDTGQYCFQIVGNGCQTFYFDDETSPVYTGGDVECFDVTADVYPVMWHYTRGTYSSGTEMRLRYCYGGSSSCTPSTALPSNILRPTYP